MSTTLASVLDHLDIVAVIAGGIFAGTALYVSIGEVPAMRAFGTDEHWRLFPYVFERAAVSQISFGVIAGVAGVVHGTRIVGSSFYRNLWIGAGSAFLVIMPYTIIFMLPTNKRILNDHKLVKSGHQSQVDVTTRKNLLDKWAVLHLVRTVGSVASYGAMIFGLSRHTSLILGW